MKLFNNRIGDKGAGCIAELVTECGGLAELHLSHNQLTDKGVEEIVLAACDRRHRRTLLWLRLEQNLVQHPAYLVDSWSDRGLDFCSAMSANGCHSTHCKFNMMVHLPFFFSQRRTTT